MKHLLENLLGNDDSLTEVVILVDFLSIGQIRVELVVIGSWSLVLKWNLNLVVV